MFFYLLLIAIVRQVKEGCSLKLIRKILLLHIMIRIIVGIQIADAMSQLRRTLIMCILQMCRDRTGLGMCHKIRSEEHTSELQSPS